MNKKSEIIDILEQVVAGHLAPSKAMELWPNPESSTSHTLKKAWHDLYHFSVDTDIQEKDPEYREYQLNLIRSNIDLSQNSSCEF